MPLFKLKAGSHVSGSVADKDGNNTMQMYSAKGPNNIVETDQDLAQIYPEKFEAYDGPAPEKQMMGPRGPISNEPQPPGPPTDQDRAEAQLLKSMTPDDRRKQAEWHRQQAEAMEQEASEGERNLEMAKQQQQASRPEQSKTQKSEEISATTKSKTTGIPADSELNQMTKEDLLEVAQREEVDVKTHDTRAEILKALRTARKG